MIIARAPLRVSLVGGSTDIAPYWQQRGGAVVSFAINRFTAVEVHYREKDYLIKYSSVERVKDVDNISNHLIAEAIRMVGITEPLEVVCMADLPESMGLGSSSSFAVSILAALHQLKYGRIPAPLELAEMACELEIERCGSPIGKQDQFIAALGGLRLIEFFPNETRSTELPNDAYDLIERCGLLVKWSSRGSASEVLRQRLPMEGTIHELDKMKALAYELFNDPVDLDKWAGCIYQNWASKCELGSVATPEIDSIINAAYEAGATAAKLCGAGLGGCFLFLVPPERRALVLQALKDCMEIPFRISRRGMQVWS